MKLVKHVQTSDGTLHQTEGDAKRYADLRYTGAAYQIGGELFNLIHGHGRVCDIVQWLDSNLERFGELATLKADSALDNPGSDGD